MMIVDAVFHIYKWEMNKGYKLLDGRLLHDINLTDELIILKNIDIKYYNQNCDEAVGLIIDDDEPYEMVHINSIFSYGDYWESLHAGMSARLECYCNIENLKDLILCKIIK